MFLEKQTTAQSGVKFIPNNNQWPSDIQFLSRIPGGNMMLKPGMFAYHFRDNGKLQRLHEQFHQPIEEAAWHEPLLVDEHLIQVNFVGSNRESEAKPTGQSKEYYNYFLGNDPARWATGLYAFQAIHYPDFYDGIDLKVYSAGSDVKYDFIVSTRANPDMISINYEGVDEIHLDSKGDLSLITPQATVIEKKPIAHQIINGTRVIVACEYVLENNNVTFCFPNGYDAGYELVIDPLLIFSTYSGSSADNWGSTATPGENGTLYSAGVTNQHQGGEFPVSAGAFQTSYGGMYDIGILKYDSSGMRLLYASYLGGTGSESAHSLIVNDQEELIVLGTTSSRDFPTTSQALDRSFNGGIEKTTIIGIEYENGSDIIISRIHKTGLKLLASTYFGGSGNDGVNVLNGALTRNYGDELRGDVITDEVGNIYISSVTQSTDFQFESGFQTGYLGGGSDGLIFKMDRNLSEIIWGTFVGGNGTDACYSIKLDFQKNIIAAGGTTSTDFPVSPDAYQKLLSGDADGWIAKISADGLSTLQGTYTGTPFYDQIYFLDLNENEEIYVYGQTAGNMPVTTGVYNNANSGQFVQKFNNSLSGLIFSTVFGSGRGIPDISPTAFLVNDCNNLYMTGWGGAINHRVGYWQNNSSTRGMAISSDAFQKLTSGNDFYFIVLTDDARSFLYGTYMGGSRSLTHVDGGTSRFDKSGVVYHAVCSGCNTDGLGPKSDFPTTPNAWSRQNRSENCNNAAFKFDLSSLRARLQTNSVEYDSPGLTFVCLPDTIRFQNKSIGGEFFEWNLGDGTTLTKSDTGSILHNYAAEGNYLVRLKAFDQGTCKVVDSTSVIVSVFRKNMFVQPDDILCEGEQYTMQASGGITYLWTSADLTFQSELSNPMVKPADTTTYYVTIQDANGCTKKDTVTLRVVPGINPSFNITREGDCEGIPSISVVNDTDSLLSDDTIFFDLGDSSQNVNDKFVKQYEKDGNYRITLTAMRRGCIFSKSLEVPVFTLYIPNVITPDHDGKNDFFTIRYGPTEITPAAYQFKTSLVVYNRWGTVVYENKDYQYDWDGSDLAGGVYYFEVSVQEHAVCKSWIQIIK